MSPSAANLVNEPQQSITGDNPYQNIPNAMYSNKSEINIKEDKAAGGHDQESHPVPSR